MAPYELFVCVETRRKSNVGTIMRCAVAFGATSVILVGSASVSTHGAHEAKKHVRMVHFYYWHECIAYVKGKGCTVVGISPYELPGTSCAVQRVGFGAFSVAFVVGERQGLSEEQVRVSDVVAHVAFPRQELEDYIPFDNKIAVALQNFASKTVGFAEHRRDGEKYSIEQEPLERRARKAVTLSASAGRQETRGVPVESEDALASLFGELGT